MRRVTPTLFPQPLLTDAIGFGAAVRAARTASGMTLTDAALAVGVARQTLQDLETGTGTVGIGAAMKIANELGVSLFAVPAREKGPINRTINATLSGHATSVVTATADLTVSKTSKASA